MPVFFVCCNGSDEWLAGSPGLHNPRRIYFCGQCHESRAAWLWTPVTLVDRKHGTGHGAGENVKVDMGTGKLEGDFKMKENTENL